MGALLIVAFMGSFVASTAGKWEEGRHCQATSLQPQFTHRVEHLHYRSVYNKLSWGKGTFYLHLVFVL